MQEFEYKVVPAPRRGEKARGVKTTADRFALAITQLMNRMAAEGWEYLRADTLPCEERVGLTGRTTSFQNLLVFRRAVVAAARPVVAPAATAMAAAEPALPRAVATPPTEPYAPAADEALPAPDPLDDAARRAVAAPPVARPTFGRAPRLSPLGEPGPAPQLGPARTGGEPPRGPGHAAE
jgi:hypothetical protein